MSERFLVKISKANHNALTKIVNDLEQNIGITVYHIQIVETVFKKIDMKKLFQDAPAEYTSVGEQSPIRLRPKTMAKIIRVQADLIEDGKKKWNYQDIANYVMDTVDMQKIFMLEQSTQRSS